MTRNYKKYKARINVIIASAILFWATLCLRLFQIQVLNGAEYQSELILQSQRKHIKIQDRGNFFDRDNRPLTRNIIHYTLSANPRKIIDKIGMANEISSITGKPINKYLNKLNSNSSFEYLERNMTRESVEGLKSNTYKGLLLEKKSRRYYPHNEIAAQLVGYTNDDNQGISGLEKYFDKYLKGELGWIYKTKGLSGKNQHKSGMPYKNPINGNNIQLTLELEYQSILEEELLQRQLETEAVSATGLILDPQTGEILAIASTPGFNNNLFSKTDPKLHRIRAITDQFEPGSTYKVVSAISGLHSDKISPIQEFNCENGHYQYYTIPIRDHDKHSMLSTSQIIQYSSNIGIIKIIERVGPKTLYNTSREIGFGSKTGIKLDGEVKGTLNPYKNWSAVSLGQIAMGHEVGVTAIQLAMAYCAIANGGYLLQPKLIRQIINNENMTIHAEDPTVIRKIASEQTMFEIKKMLRNVIINGTGKNAEIAGWKIAGKTGTAQKWVDGKYSNNKFISNFVGFFPVEDPQLLTLVIIDEPKQPYHWGGQGAAIAFKRIMKRIISMDDSISPPTFVNHDKIPSSRGKNIIRSSKKELPINTSIPTELSIKTKFPKKFKIPDLRGLSMRKAMNILNNNGILFEMIGSGRVARQSPKAGTIIDKKTKCIIELKQ